ncbi:MAG: hypothetical protein ACOC38_05840 [Promethearchaeia archaeon]
MTDRDLEERVKELEARVQKIEAFLQSELLTHSPEISDHFEGSFQSRPIRDPFEEHEKDDENKT